MTIAQILNALYTMALESAESALADYVYTYDYAIASDGVQIGVMVAANQHSTGNIILTCEHEQFSTNNFDLAAQALFNALQYS